MTAATHESADSFYEAIYDDVVLIHDRHGQFWLAWETENGDWFASRSRCEDDDRGPDGDPWRPVGPAPLDALPFPVRATVARAHLPVVSQ